MGGFSKITLGSVMKDIVIKIKPNKTTKQGSKISQHKLFKSLLKYLALFINNAMVWLKNS